MHFLATQLKDDNMASVPFKNEAIARNATAESKLSDGTNEVTVGQNVKMFVCVDRASTHLCQDAQLGSMLW